MRMIAVNWANALIEMMMIMLLEKMVDKIWNHEWASSAVFLKYRRLLREVFNRWSFPRKTESRNIMIDTYINAKSTNKENISSVQLCWVKQLLQGPHHPHHHRHHRHHHHLHLNNHFYHHHHHRHHYLHISSVQLCRVKQLLQRSFLCKAEKMQRENLRLPVLQCWRGKF